MSNLVMSCSGCNNLRGDMKFNKFLKLRRDEQAWTVYCKMKAANLRERKTKFKAKRAPKQEAFVWKIALLLYLQPEWKDHVEEIRQHFAEITRKKRERLNQRIANSSIDPAYIT